MSRFDDLLKAKKLKPGEPDLSPSVALSKSKDPNFVRTTFTCQNFCTANLNPQQRNQVRK
jgi:hypothetical protein